MTFKLIYLIFLIFLYAFVAIICGIGHDYSKGPLTGRRKKIAHFCFHYIYELNFITFRVGAKAPKYIDMDYTEYLGPDYKSKTVYPKRVSTIVANHVQVIDAFLIFYLLKTSPVAATDVWYSYLPCFKVAQRAMDSIQVTRYGIPEET